MTTAAEELLDRLVLVDDLDDLPGVLSQAINVRGTELLATLDAAAARLDAAGRRREAALLRFLRPHVEGALPEWARAVSADPAELVVRAAALPDQLARFRFARANPALLTETAVARAREVVATPATPEPVRDAHAALFALLGVMTGMPEVAAEARLTWATVLRKQRRYARSLFHARRASADAPDWLKSGALGSVAASYADAGDLDAATEMLQAALEVERTPRTRASLHWAIARNLRELGRSAEAVGHVDTALDIMAELTWRDPATWDLLNLRGLLHEDNGRYEYGAADFHLARAEAVAQGDHHHEFVSWTNYAASLVKANRPHASLRVFRHIHQQVRDRGDQGHLAAALNNLAHAYMSVGELEEAARHYAEALESEGQAMTESAMTSLFGLGDVLRDRGGDSSPLYHLAFATGLAAGTEVAAVSLYATRMTGENEDPEGERRLRDLLIVPATAQRWVVRVQVSLALAAYLERHADPAEAAGILRELVAEADRRGAFVDSVRARVRLAKLLSRDEALSVLQTARAALLDHLIRSPDQRRSGEIAAEFIDVYETLIDLLVDGDAPSGDDVAAAFDLHEEARARSFLANLADLPRPAPTTVPTDLAERETALLAERRDLQRDFAVLEGAALRARLARLDAVAAELVDVHKAMAPFAPEHARLRQALPVTLADVRELLARHAPAEGVTVVSYFCGRRTTTCFTLSSADGEPRVHRAPVGAAEVTAVVEGLTRSFNGDPAAFPPLGPIHPRRPHRRSLHDLDELGPQLLPNDLDGQPLVCVVPHGPLHLLPVHTLPDAAGIRLVERAAVTYAPSLSLLTHVMAQPPRRPGRALVAAVAAREDPRPEVFEDDARILRDAGWAVTDLSGTAATKHAVLAELVGQDLVHLTCHGYTHPHDHMESGLVLADEGDRPSKFSDGLTLRQRRRAVLRAEDVAQHGEPVRLVTLRACASGRLTHEHAGDEFTGLSRALLGGGAAATLTALWNVNQHSSRELLRETYRGWQAGAPLWRALWAAQRAFLADKTRPWLRHPYHWAPLVLTGDWR